MQRTDPLCVSPRTETTLLWHRQGNYTRKNGLTLISTSWTAGSIDMLPRGCLVIFDDCLEIKSDFRSKVLYDLLTQIATVGRHHTSSRNIPTEFLCLTHHGSRRELATVRNAARFWTLFPRGSKQQCVHILKNRLQLGKKAIETLLNHCGNSRTATFDMHHPMKLISENHVELLD